MYIPNIMNTVAISVIVVFVVNINRHKTFNIKIIDNISRISLYIWNRILVTLKEHYKTIYNVDKFEFRDKILSFSLSVSILLCFVNSSKS
jgi:predicted nucleic acid-binding protein